MLNRILIWLTLSLSSTVWSASPHQLTAAARHYQKGEFEQAISLYERLARTQATNASLFHKLGLAYYRNGQLGYAVAAHLHALHLLPQDTDLRYNLQLLLRQTRDKLEPRLHRHWLEAWSLSHWFSERLIYYSLCITLLVTSGFLALWMSDRKGSWLAGMLTVLGALTCAYLLLSFVYHRQWSLEWGAIAANRAEVFSSPTAVQAVAIFALHEGAPVALVEARGAWVKIALSDYKTGWIRREDLAAFGPRYGRIPQPAAADASPTL